MIPESFIQELLARTDIEDVVGRYVQLRKGGANLLGLCPFHNEKTPSFTVSPTKQFYHCFGCGAHGSAIKFLMEHTGASFPEAVRSLAAQVGLSVPEQPRTPRQREAERRHRTERSRHQQLLDTAQRHYVQQLKTTQPAIDYLRQRGLTGELAARFGLGWSGEGRRALASVMPDYDDPGLIEVGLVIESEDGRRYDRFRQRVMFPIRDARGQLVGFGGRLIAKGEPKYLNSPETTLFSKSNELYGLWESRAGIRQEGCVVVVEGYMDVVGLAQHGLANAVATLGTATTAVHVQKLMRASNRIVFCFDGDDAGRRAAWRALTVCLPLLRDDVAIRFLFLPGRHDPDSYIREYGVKAFRACLAEAQALSQFLLAELASRHPMQEPEGRAACVHEARPLLVQLPDSTLRTQILREFADLVRLTPEELDLMLVQTARVATMRSNTEPLRAERPHTDKVTGVVPAGRDHNVNMDAMNSGTHIEMNSAVPAGFGAQSAMGPDPETASRRVGRRSVQRRVTPMAKRLLRLLLAHPALINDVGDQQLEILLHSPHLVLVRDLITLANVSGARHAGAFLEAADPDSDLAAILASLVTGLLAEEDLPDPLAEWNDALRKIELEAIKAEQSALIQAGLRDETSQKRYQELTRQLALLNSATPRQLT